jgi:6-phosphofructokinase 1
MPSDHEALDFVTLEGLLRYGEAMSQAARIAPEHISLPSTPPAVSDRIARARQATDAMLLFANRVQHGFASAADYRLARRRLLDEACGGDALVFFAAWNRLVAGARSALYCKRPSEPSRNRPVDVLSPLCPARS